jgi:aryl-alcohol dehydrogenase-like predicted oxidoreductase
MIVGGASGQPRLRPARAPAFARRSQLPAGGHDATPARRAHRRGISGVVEDARESAHRLVGRALERRSRAQVALAWVVQKPVVTAPIVGASKPDHLDDAVAALSLQLTPEEIEALQELYVPHPVVGFS